MKILTPVSHDEVARLWILKVNDYLINKEDLWKIPDSHKQYKVGVNSFFECIKLMNKKELYETYVKLMNI